MPEYALSIVVIGRNEGDRLERCLESVARMTFAGSFEVIYVDSASSDGSASRAADLGAKVELKGGRPSAGRARNAGWRISSGPLVLFLDGDTIVDPDFVVRAFPEFQDTRVMVVSGHRREIHPEASIYSRVLDLNWSCPPGPAEFCGGDALMRRTALEETDGFNADLIAGEEPDLCRRIRARGGLILNSLQYWRQLTIAKS
jgi:glycosyltransferase involved in cell wall biosynthesis